MTSTNGDPNPVARVGPSDDNDREAVGATAGRAAESAGDLQPGQHERSRILTLTLPGMTGALLFAVLSFLPSLMPRSGLFQGLITGVTAAIGYGLGLGVAWFWRAVADREEKPTLTRSWWILGGVAVVTLLLAIWSGQRWQGELRDLMEIQTPGPMWIVTLPIAAIASFWLIIGIARLIRAIYRALFRLLDRWIGARAARGLGWAAAAILALFIASGVLYDGFLSAADQVFSVNNGITPDGIEQPTTELRSSGPGSAITWESLGREGRKFIGQGPVAQQIEGVTGTAAMETIRAYAGLDTAGDSEDRAQAAVNDLERAGGFERSALLVATTTGSGWLDPASVDAFEYLGAGDTAIVSMQYSYLPSWISFLVDQQRARQAGRDLFDAVYERWLELPADDRPELYVFGESLGSFGGETAFSGEIDMRNRVDGAVFAGPPNFNTLWRDFTDSRDEGTPEIRPTFRDGRVIRFASEPTGQIPPQGQPWDDSRVVYLQHASDPIVWWSPDLLLNEPDWMNEPSGPDVLDATTAWVPLVSFWTITADMANSTGVPGGHGHVYSAEYVDAWSQVLRTDLKEDRIDIVRQVIEDSR